METFKSLLLIVLSSALVNNFVLSRYLGCCPFLGVSSKVNVEWAFLKHLHDVGYRITEAWLEENFKHLGKRSTLDVESVYLH